MLLLCTLGAYSALCKQRRGEDGENTMLLRTTTGHGTWDTNAGSEVGPAGERTVPLSGYGGQSE